MLAWLSVCSEVLTIPHGPAKLTLPLTVSSLREIQISFTFLVPAHSGSRRQKVVKWVLLFDVTEYTNTHKPTHLSL